MRKKPDGKTLFSRRRGKKKQDILLTSRPVGHALKKKKTTNYIKNTKDN